MRQEKQLLVDVIKDQIKSAPAFLIASYKGVNPNLASDFRNRIVETGGFFYVVGKRIFLKAAEESGSSIDRTILDGHLGVIYTGDDAVSTTKAVFQFGKENEGMLTVLGGHFEGNLCSSEDVKKISELPSKEVMRAEFLGLLEAPMSGTLAVIEAILSSIVYCIENKLQKEESST